MLGSYTIVDDKIHIDTLYCSQIVTTCRSWGGEWNGKVWIISKHRLKEVVEKLGSIDSPQVEVEVNMDQVEVTDATYHIGWFVLAERKNRDYKAKVFADMIAGTIPSSGGSAKYPRVNASDDSIFTLFVPLDFAKSHDLKIIEEPLLTNPLEKFSDEEIYKEFHRRKLK